MARAVLVIDIQNDYFAGGGMELVAPEAAAANAARLLARFRETGEPIVHVQHVRTQPGAAWFAPGTQGVETHASVAPTPGETVIVKHLANSFRETPLLDHLRALSVGELVICGMMTHMCVHAAARAGADLGFACRVIHDACATRDLAFGGVTVPAAHVHAAFLAALQGMYATVLSADEFLAEQ